MTTTTHPATRLPAPSLPWAPVLALALAAFAMVTAEMLPTAVLPHMAADLGVSEARVGLLVSGWAAVVVLLSFPLVRLTSRWDRRAVITGSMVVLAAANALTAVAPSYAGAGSARFVAAAATGLLWASVNAHLADVVPEDRLARAVAVMLGGAILGMVLAVPVANAVASTWGWRTTFAAVAVLAAVAAVLVARARTTATAVAPAADEPVGTDPGALRRVVALAVIGGIVIVGHFGVFTFIAPLVGETGRSLPGGVSGLLLVFGLASGLGVLLVGRWGDRRPGLALALSALLTAVAIAGLTIAGTSTLATLAVLVLWGGATGALPPLLQTAIMRTAGVRLRSLAGTLIPVALNLGIAAGAALGSAVVAVAGVDAVPVPAALVALVGAGLLAVLLRRTA